MKKLYTVMLLAYTSAILAQQGALDPTFNPQTPAATFARAVVLQNDGKVIAGGSFAAGIMRLNSNGSADNSFAAGTGFNGTVAAIAIQNDGKIIVGGNFTAYNSSGAARIVRLNTNGTIDNTFTTGSGFGVSPRGTNSQQGVNSIEVQPDGRILIGGCFDSYNGTPVQDLIRLNTDGSPDNSFSVPPGVTSYVTRVKLLSNGQILASGRLSMPVSGFVKLMARFNSDGSLDNTFTNNVNIGPTNVAEVYDMAEQTDGKIVVTGSFNYFSSPNTKRLCRLNADGTLDNTFMINQISPGIFFEGRALALQTDGKILVGGACPFPSADTLNRVIRVNTDGTLDNTFVTGAGVNSGDVYALTMQGDGKLILAGNFKAYNSTPRNGLARLNGETLTGLTTRRFSDDGFSVFPNPGKGVFNLILSRNENVHVTVTDVFGKTVFSFPVTQTDNRINISDYAPGVYCITITTAGGTSSNKVIVKE